MITSDKKPIFELVLIVLSIIGAVFLWYFIFVVKHRPDGLASLLVGVGSIAGLLSLPTFIINIFRRTFWLWYARAPVILLSSGFYIFTASYI